MCLDLLLDLLLDKHGSHHGAIADILIGDGLLLLLFLFYLLLKILNFKVHNRFRKLECKTMTTYLLFDYLTFQGPLKRLILELLSDAGQLLKGPIIYLYPVLYTKSE